MEPRGASGAVRLPSFGYPPVRAGSRRSELPGTPLAVSLELPLVGLSCRSAVARRKTGFLRSTELQTNAGAKVSFPGQRTRTPDLNRSVYGHDHATRNDQCRPMPYLSQVIPAYRRRFDFVLRPWPYRASCRHQREAGWECCHDRGRRLFLLTT